MPLFSIGNIEIISFDHQYQQPKKKQESNGREKYTATMEKSLRKTPYKYLLKYDRVKLFGFFSSKLYSITDIKNSTELSKDEINYLIIKSKQRALKRINSKINKLNRYYNSNTELFARAIELFIKDKEYFKNNAPTLYDQINNAIETSRVPELRNLILILENKS